MLRFFNRKSAKMFEKYGKRGSKDGGVGWIRTNDRGYEHGERQLRIAKEEILLCGF
jgi:hypothetical protein